MGKFFEYVYFELSKVINEISLVLRKLHGMNKKECYLKRKVRYVSNFFYLDQLRCVRFTKESLDMCDSRI